MIMEIAKLKEKLKDLEEKQKNDLTFEAKVSQKTFEEKQKLDKPVK